MAKTKEGRGVNDVFIEAWVSVWDLLLMPQLVELTYSSTLQQKSMIRLRTA